ncbi:MAG: amidase domain-containing protein, partial [Methanocella sp.]
ADLAGGAPYPVPSEPEPPSLPGAERPTQRYNRTAAVAYADRYCGVRIREGDGRYNQRYRDYTDLGGDCANFASQVLTDPKAGGIPQDWAWFSYANTASGAWLVAEDLVHHLLGTGRATLLARGAPPAISAPTPAFPKGPLYHLSPGDIIGYERQGRIVHVSVVAGRDSSGYPVVDSHSGDRYRVPWDLGYHSRVKYWLLRIVY